MYCPICDQKPMNCDCTEDERRMYSENEDLEIEVERLRAERRWIPVSERLPDDETELLVAWSGTDMTVSYAVFRHVDKAGEQVWQDAYGCDLKQPTHWMPLPEPPEVK